jgi:hypothetical protein
MRVLLCHEPADAGDMRDLLGALRGGGFEAAPLCLESSWEEGSTAGLEPLLEQATHYLLLWSASSAASTWLPYLAGLCAGRKAHAAVYRIQASPRLPAYLQGLSLIDSPGELRSYYAAERESWLVEHDRAMAKRELLDMGTPFTIDAMAERVREGDIRAVSLFVRAGMGPGSRDRHGVPMLCLAARARHRRTAALLVSLGAELDAQSDDRGNSALMDAAAAGSPDIVADLVAKGARVDLKSKDGQTALVIAVGKRDRASVEVLLAAGADPDDADKLGYSARKYAELFKDAMLVELFSRYPPRAG